MAKYIAPQLTITSTTVSASESYNLKISDSLLVAAPLSNLTSVNAVTPTGTVLFIPAVDTWLYATNKDSTIEVTITDATNTLAVIGPGEFCFFKLDSTLASCNALAASGTPEIEFGYWTKG